MKNIQEKFDSGKLMTERCVKGVGSHEKRPTKVNFETDP